MTGNSLAIILIAFCLAIGGLVVALNVWMEMDL